MILTSSPVLVFVYPIFSEKTSHAGVFSFCYNILERGHHMYRNSDIKNVIEEYIHNGRDREILRLRYVDGQTYETIAENVDMSPRQIQNIINRHKETIISFT